MISLAYQHCDRITRRHLLKHLRDNVLKLIKTEDYETVFGNSGEKIYSEWTDYIKNYYQ